MGPDRERGEAVVDVVLSEGECEETTGNTPDILDAALLTTRNGGCRSLSKLGVPDPGTLSMDMDSRRSFRARMMSLRNVRVGVSIVKLVPPINKMLGRQLTRSR